MTRLTSHMTAYQGEGEPRIAAISDFPELPVGQDFWRGAFDFVNSILANAYPHKVVVRTANETLASQFLEQTIISE